MRIVNETKYATIDLKRIFSACLREIQKTEKSKILKNLKVIVVYGKHPGMSGCATYNRGWMKIRVPSPNVFFYHLQTWLRFYRDASSGYYYLFKSDYYFQKRLAHIFIHEAGHCIGIRHVRTRIESRKSACRTETIEGPYMEWIEETFEGNDNFPITFIGDDNKSKLNVVDKRYETAVSNMKKAQTRLKRAKTIHDKWQRKVRYYENKLAAIK